jgi:hypothetical protein
MPPGDHADVVVLEAAERVGRPERTGLRSRTNCLFAADLAMLFVAFKRSARRTAKEPSHTVTISQTVIV